MKLRVTEIGGILPIPIVGREVDEGVLGVKSALASMAGLHGITRHLVNKSTEIGSICVMSKWERRMALTACSMICDRLKPSWHTGITKSDFCRLTGMHSMMIKKRPNCGIPEIEGGSKRSEPPASMNWFITSRRGVGSSGSYASEKRGRKRETSNCWVDQNSADFWRSEAKEVGSAANSIDFDSMKRRRGVSAMRFNRGSVESASFWAFLSSKRGNVETGETREDRTRWDAIAGFPSTKRTPRTWKPWKPRNHKGEPGSEETWKPNNGVNRGYEAPGDAINEIGEGERFVFHSNFLRFNRGEKRLLRRSLGKRRSSILCERQCVEAIR